MAVHDAHDPVTIATPAPARAGNAAAQRLPYRTAEPPAADRARRRLAVMVGVVRTHPVFRAVLRVIAVLLLGTAGFLAIVRVFSRDPTAHGLLDALYFAAISLTTVGYGDNLNLLGLPEPGRTIAVLFTIGYLLSAYATVVWTSSTVVAYFVEGSITDVLWRRRMLRRIETLEGHYLLCGLGHAGSAILEEMARTGHVVVLIEQDHHRIEGVRAAHPADALLAIEGDATEEETLMQAGIRRASGVICNLSNDRDNLFLTLTARAMNPRLRIVVRGAEARSREKLVRAGADSVVYPDSIGGMRMTSEMIRPAVVSFLDRMVRDTRGNVRISEVTVGARSACAGQTLGAARLYDATGLRIVALLPPGASPEAFVYNPSDAEPLTPGTVLVVVGDVEQVQALARLTAAT
jgi:voltage-gated potassium channel